MATVEVGGGDEGGGAARRGVEGAGEGGGGARARELAMVGKFCSHREILNMLCKNFIH